MNEDHKAEIEEHRREVGVKGKYERWVEMQSKLAESSEVIADKLFYLKLRDKVIKMKCLFSSTKIAIRK